MSSSKKVTKPTLLLQRHAATSWNTGDPATDRAKGSQNDIPIDARGQSEAESDARKLARYDIAEIHHSKMKRSVQTIAPLVKLLPDAKVVATEALDPWDVGYLSGQLRREIADRIDYYIAHPRRQVPDGDSYGNVWKRSTDYVAMLMKLAKAAADDGQAILADTHSDIVELICSWLDGTVPGAHTVEHSMAPASIVGIVHDGRRWTWDEWEGSKGEKDEE